MNIKKYNPTHSFKLISPKIVKSLMEGMTANEVCIMYGISETTLYKWKKVNESFGKACKKAERHSARSTIKEGLRNLAKGHEVSEEQTEFYDTSVDSKGVEHKVKRTIRTRRLPPDIKAIRMLASKHAQGEYLEDEANKLGVEIRITQKDRALSIEERLTILRKDKEEGEAPVDVEYKELSD